MFSSRHYWKIILFLFVLVIINIPLLFLVYSDILLAAFDPLASSGLGVVKAAIWSYMFGDWSQDVSEVRGGLLPFGRILAGVFLSIAFAWDDIILQSDDLNHQWFWSMAFCSYIGWILGSVIIRNYRIKKTSETIDNSDSDEKPSQKPDEPLGELFG